MTLQLWETLKEAITAYTSLSPAAFFTVIALAFAFYYVVSGQPYSAEPQTQVEPLRPPVQLGEITEDELNQYDGSDSKKPLLMAIKGQIYDVSQSKMFYGPGGPYDLFTGKDASRALANMSVEDNDLTGDISGLGPFELDTLQDWEYEFMSKYVKVGTIKKKDAVVTNEESKEGLVPKTNAEETGEEVAAIGARDDTSISEDKKLEEKDAAKGDADK